MDDKLNWDANTTSICKQSNQTLYFLRKLKLFYVSNQILKLFYQSTVQLVVPVIFCCISWFNSLTPCNCTKLKCIDKQARIIGADFLNIQEIAQNHVSSKFTETLSDTAHCPTLSLFEINLAGCANLLSKQIQIFLFTMGHSHF